MSSILKKLETENRKPTRIELVRLYRGNVCPEINDLALECMKDLDLTRAVVRALFEHNMEKYQKRWYVVRRMANIFSVHESTVYRWIPSEESYPKFGAIRQVNEEGQEVGSFTSVPHAAKETGLPASGIYNSLKNGHRCYGFIFEERQE